MTRRFGNSDKITEAKEVLTLVRGGFGSLQGSATINWGTPTIGTIEPDDGDSAGVSINPARSDHQHAIVCDAPSADSVKVTGSTEGSSTSFARADHTHNLDESITPTWTGATHTFDDGSGDSPAIQMVGGSNNDTAKIYLADDITATDSDLVIQLCDAGGDSVLAIHDSSPAAVLELDSNGNIEMQNDGAWIGRGAASARTVYNASGNAVSLYSAADLVLYSDAGSTQVGLWDGATGNITLVDDAWIGLGAASTRMVFDETSGNSLDLYSGMDLRLFSDTGSTQVGLWDGATGSITLADGATVGQAAGPLLTFDDTNNYLEITGCNVGVGITAPSGRFTVAKGSDSVEFYTDSYSTTDAHQADLALRKSANNTVGSITATGDGESLGQITWYGVNISPAFTAAGGLRMVQSEAAAGGYTQGYLEIFTYTSSAKNNNQLQLDTNGSVGIGVAPSLGKLHIDQSNASGAQPVLYLDQGDVSEEMIEFASTIGTGNAIEAVGGKSLTTTHFIKVTLPGSLTRYIPVGTIA